DPLLQGEVVPGADAGERDGSVARRHERLPTETRERRKEDRREDPVDVHVLQALRGVVAAGSHAAPRDALLVPVVRQADMSEECRDLLALSLEPPGQKSVLENKGRCPIGDL